MNILQKCFLIAKSNKKKKKNIFLLFSRFQVNEFQQMNCSYWWMHWRIFSTKIFTWKIAIEIQINSNYTWMMEIGGKNIFFFLNLAELKDE